jgi:hypothetical protein
VAVSGNSAHTTGVRSCNASKGVSRSSEEEGVVDLSMVGG